jgi:GTP-binding protein
VLLTKADKLPKGKAAAAVHRVERQLSAYDGQFGVEQFSSLALNGVSALRSQITEWIEDSIT